MGIPVSKQDPGKKFSFYLLKQLLITYTGLETGWTDESYAM